MESTPQPPPPLPPPPANCSNCGAPLHGKFCSDCGQPIEGLVRHFGSVLGDVMDSLFNIDGRTAHTLLPLYFRPGKITLDYFAGRRARYVTPFRLIFLLAIVAFLAIQLMLRTSSTPIVQYDSTTPPTASVTADPAPSATAQDNPFANGDIKLNDKVVWNRQSKPWQPAWLPGFADSWLNDAIEHARNNLHDMSSGNTADTKRAARRLMDGTFAVAPQVLFALLPVFALLLKVFYVFKRRLYMEHLIVAMHSHAFIMLSVLVLVALALLRSWLAPHAAWIGGLFGLLQAAGWIWLLAYLLIMQKRVYRQGWFMTWLKYLGVGLCYSVLLAIGTTFALLLSLGST